MKCEVKFSSAFKTSFKKISDKDKELFYEVLEKIGNNEVLDEKYKNHKLQGDYKDCFECHIKSYLLLIYRKVENILICVDIGNKSDLFK
ncbi:type II toxin-antitoxin system mRNA interferase toxin, RelE/StbE family [Helicobacter saguini]|uniref:Type II toxin-antitoxin system YafQ family toxin n=1 Tax=Helicobacter saguini TaxID=1548018 RepID=A0A347VX65_9HELI|nr:type II toxin-antitoxin system YafQ family toxin [Helicobacter saguini]MWV61755.1 type II toxin-antitoxin system mRNA interferase toxin, RelE/StbE family [Helicobacter saguini]MWV67572.1 type II toxin-antitoxin system mRNA interferase toxin, RelE/StbE family [Helicobacter saguini]MWV69923.1 type II toxin-antitoxin system mRNA interferase toxin, RelE/StbE family [Helicobacter saguini]MWV72862.1 type II toxin-antitoxin system mRNA interferase toxin, RelE/StbE family [Helicobacter saguini]TLD9